MRIGIVGTGRIGANAARLFAKAGHDVVLSFSRDQDKLEALAAELGGKAGSPREAVEASEVVLFSVPWRLIDDVLEQTGSLDGRIVIDTTNQFGAGGVEDLGGRTAAQVNAARMPGAHYTKAFNTLTSGFQAQSAGRTGSDRVVMFLCGDDEDAKRVVAGVIDDAGFTPIDLGGTADAAPMEPPRRSGAVYGEEVHEDEARALVERLGAQ
jgi:predicted dinucleotide-binding enzyme